MTELHKFPILPLKATQFLGKIVNFGGRLNLMPYKWNQNTGSAQFKGGVLTKIMYFTQFVMVLLYQVFLIHKCAAFLRNPAEKLQRKIRLSYLTAAYIILNVQHLVTLKEYGSLHLFINRFMDLTSNINGQYGPIRIKGEKKILRLMKIVSYGVSLGGSNALGVFFAPKSPTLLTSLFENPKSLPLVVKLLLGSVHVVINMFHLYPTLLYFSILSSYVCTVGSVVNRFRYAATKTNSTTRTINPSELCRCYSQLGILQSHFNSTFRLWTIGMEVFGIFFIDLNIFQAVEFNNVRSLILGVAASITFIFLFTEFSQIHERSTVTLSTWKYIPKPNWFVKYRQSCKPLSVTIGSFYFADKGLPLTILAIIISNTANLIVTFNDDHGRVESS